MTVRPYTDEHRAQKRRYYQAVVAEGDCWRCRVEPAAKPSVYCEACRADRNKGGSKVRR